MVVTSNQLLLQQQKPSIQLLQIQMQISPSHKLINFTFKTWKTQLFNKSKFHQKFSTSSNNQKTLKRGQPGSLASHKSASNPLSSLTREAVDLMTIQSQSPTQWSHLNNPLRKHRHIQWDDTKTQINFQPTSTPLQTFANSNTLTCAQMVTHPFFNTPQIKMP